ncbi:MAG: hypothetical protein ACKOQ1_07255, partial [Actinomycetota bacterium]
MREPGADGAETFPAASVTVAVNVQVPPDIGVMSHDDTVADATNAHDAVAPATEVFRPLMVIVVPGSAPETVIVGVGSVESGPLNDGGDGAEGTVVSITIVIGVDGGDVFPATSMIRAVIVHGPSLSGGSVHDFTVGVATKVQEWVVVAVARTPALATDSVSGESGARLDALVPVFCVA